MFNVLYSNFYGTLPYLTNNVHMHSQLHSKKLTILTEYDIKQGRTYTIHIRRDSLVTD